MNNSTAVLLSFSYMLIIPSSAILSVEDLLILGTISVGVFGCHSAITSAPFYRYDTISSLFFSSISIMYIVYH